MATTTAVTKIPATDTQIDFFARRFAPIGSETVFPEAKTTHNQTFPYAKTTHNKTYGLISSVDEDEQNEKFATKNSRKEAEYSFASIYILFTEGLYIGEY